MTPEEVTAAIAAAQETFMGITGTPTDSGLLRLKEDIAFILLRIPVLAVDNL